MNKIIIIGNLTRDVDEQTTNSGKNVARFSVAVNRISEGCDFFNVVAWGDLGERCGRYLSKGKKCCVDGRVEMREYEARDGVKRSVTEIIAERVEFLSPKDEITDVPKAHYSPAPKPPEKAKQRALWEVDEDLPF